MDTFKKNQGITLTELLVSSIMIGIVMIAVASFSTSMKQLEGSTSKSVIVAERTKAAMAQITRDASLAVGDSTNLGVVDFTDGTTTSICFRHDALVTPDNYADDRSVCYIHDGANNITRCANGAAAPFPASCNDLITCCPGGTQQVLFFKKSPTGNRFSEAVFDGSGRLQYINITLTHRFDRSQAMNPIQNPEYILTSQISPSGHSR